MSITKAKPGTTRIGWIGTGVMGRWMCQHLMNKGYAATVYNRTKTSAQPLLDAGATWADTPADVAGRSDVVFRHRRLSEGRARGLSWIRRAYWRRPAWHPIWWI